MELKIDKNGNYIITNELINIAKKQGLSKRQITQRINRDGMEIEKAITQPLRVCNSYKQYWAQLDKMGISKKTFHKRIERGWSIERALNTPLVRHSHI